MDLRLLLRVWKRFGDDHALHMVRHTLDRMAMGGIYDHLGGGFARYSTDARWLVPHFEKMLYDNALLVPLLPGSVSGHRRAVLSRDRRGDAGLGAARDDQPGRAVLQHARRRQRGRGGQVLRLDRRGDRAGARQQDAADCSTRSTASSRRATGNTARTSCIRAKTFDQYARLTHVPRSRSCEAVLAECRQKLFAVRGKARPAGPRREGADGVERPDDRRLRPGRRRCWTSRRTPRPPPAPPTSS